MATGGDEKEIRRVTLCIAPIADLSASDNVLMSWECTATGRLSLALSDDPPRSAVMFIQGNPRGDIGAADRARWDAATGLTFPAAVSTHTEAVLWLHTGLADPAGIDAPLPLGPTADGRYELWMGGEPVCIFGQLSTPTRFLQAKSQAQAKQRQMQLRKIKRMAAAKDIAAIREHVGRFGMAKLRNYLGRPLGRDWQNKAQDMLDHWFDGETELKRAIKAQFPKTDYSEDGSGGSGAWTERTSGFVATTWGFSAGTISQTPVSTTGRISFQEYSSPLSSDDMWVEETLGTQTSMITPMMPLGRSDNVASINGYGTQVTSANGNIVTAEFNSGSAANIGSATGIATPASGDKIGIYCNGTTLLPYWEDQSGTSIGAVVSDTTHQGVDHVYFAVGGGQTDNSSDTSRISLAYAADLFAAASGGGRRPRAFRVGA